MNILSLFDGMSCGQIAINKLNIPYNNYFASEIDKYAIETTKKNYPNTKHIGSVVDVNADELPNIDLLIGGSPCQNFSFACKPKGMVTKNNIEILSLDHYLEMKEDGYEFSGESYLFWEYVRLLKQTNPKYFLLENVVMPKKWENLITEIMGVKPILINSNLVSAQDRKRLYWTNIEIGESRLEDKGIVLKDIVIPSEEVEPKFWYDKEFEYKGDDHKIQCILGIKGHDILKRVYNLNNKCGTLTKCGGGNLQKKVYQDSKCRKLTPLEYERLQTVPDNYTEGVSNTQRYNMLGNGWTVDVITFILRHMA
jgi:site-specific DNA-cytosine methylase